MTTDSPMVSPVQSIMPSPASKKTPVTGVRSGGEVRSASASSGSAKPAQSGSAETSSVPDSAAGGVQPMDIEQTEDKDETRINPNNYHKSQVESLSDGEEQPPDHESNTEDFDDDPGFDPGQA